ARRSHHAAGKAGGAPVVEGRRGGEPELGRVSPRLLLETQGLTRYFGGLAAVDHVDLTVDKGEIVGLIGPNGAGKTTCFNLLSGFLRPTRGSIVLDFTGLAAHAHQLSRNLPHGHQRVLGIAMALAAEPRLLLLDEP